MDESELLARRFEESRHHLKAVAFRMLGSATDADDAVQEAWVRLSRSGASGVDNLGGWLTTIVARVCLDILRSRKSRREEPLVGHEPDGAAGPEHEAVLADSVGLALLVVLETLAPAERVAFVLHDMFDLPFDDIARIVDRSPGAARQLASRARRRVQGAPAAANPDAQRKRDIVDAFLAASRGGDLAALITLLDPDVVLTADQAAVSLGSTREVRGSEAVAAAFSGRARAARAALVDGAAGAVWATGGKPRVVFLFTIAEERIVAIELVAEAARFGELELVF
jgi:RNA polymerase sigma factor (sigma-70 family)